MSKRTSKKAKHPRQPVVLVTGILRFKQNAIVVRLLEEARRHAKYDMNEIAQGNFSNEDREQFAQLIGYSVSGAGDLSYVSDAVIEAAQAEGEALLRK